jgi:hypothetical protein
MTSTHGGEDGHIDHNPTRRAALLVAARRTLREADVAEDELRYACRVILAHSADPGERMLARQLLSGSGTE